ncbi:MAG: hypothetical protein RMJ16_12930 [Thermoguttaceae bacterium]|nr:hypothetical protein [Thermoguttaceae bacterium]
MVWSLVGDRSWAQTKAEPGTLPHNQLTVVASATSVPRFTRIEFRVVGAPPPAADKEGDTGQLVMVVRTPSGRSVRVPAFWFQPYERRSFPGQGARSDWFYPSGDPVWLVRFCPWETGRHEGFAELRAADGTTQVSQTISFDCTPSDRRGFLRKSRKDPRFFETSDGRTFFAIGQNLAFVGGSQYFNLCKLEETLPHMASEGVNYLRVWTCCEDWALCIEGRKSAWTRTWHWKLPVEELPGETSSTKATRYVVIAGPAGTERIADPSWPVAVRPESPYVLSGRIRPEKGAAVVVEVPSAGRKHLVGPSEQGGWVDFQISFTTGRNQLWLGPIVFRLQNAGKAYVDGLSLREVNTGGRLGPELLWEANVNRPARGFYNPTDCAMLDYVVELAERHGIYLQLCMLTRDLYMWALKDPQSPAYEQAIRDAMRFFRYAIARWGSSPAVAAWEYWNEMDPNLPTDRFYEELGRFFEENDPYSHLRTTSTWHPSPRDMKHPRLDIADMHFYLRPSEKRLRDEVEAVLDRARLLRQNAPGKPALLSEFGLATEQWALSAQMKADREAVHFHNALWASAFTGLSGTAMFWWWEELDRLQAYRHYGPLARFLEDIPWHSGELRAFDDLLAGGTVRLLGLRTDSAAWCWLINRDATWVGAMVDGRRPNKISSAELVVDGLRPGTYTVRWFDPWKGSWLEALAERVQSGPNGVRVRIPEFVRDLACQIAPVEPADSKQ